MKTISREYYDNCLDGLIQLIKKHNPPKSQIKSCLHILKILYNYNICLPVVIFISGENTINLKWEYNNRVIIIQIYTNTPPEYILEDNDELMNDQDLTCETGMLKYNLEDKLKKIESWIHTGLSYKDQYNANYRYNKNTADRLLSHIG